MHFALCTRDIIGWDFWKSGTMKLIFFLSLRDFSFVAQVAGKIQGLIDGDLGDLGSASLTECQLVQLLELGINDVIRDFGKEANVVTVSRQRRQKSSNQSVWCPIDDRQKLQLEVVTRLLACAQRLYISRESWDALDNPDETLAAFLKVPSSNKDGEWIHQEVPDAQELSAGIQAKSPWIDLVLRKLVPQNFRYTIEIESSNENTGSSKAEHSFSPVLELISNDISTNLQAIPYLAIVGASAELFPAGECWASSTTANWHQLVPEDKLREDVIWCHSSSVLDLESLLTILSKLLEEHGQPESDPRVQYWILLVLTKLTETTASLTRHLRESRDNRQNLESLTMIWKTIWKTLLRSDLRYTSFTNLGENSLGEIFVLLMTDIISRRCTEIPDATAEFSEYNGSPTFVREQQKAVWNLLLRKPAIFSKVKSRAQFELISSISKFAGLVDPPNTEGTKRPLRSELLRLTLLSFKEVLTKGNTLGLESSTKLQLLRSIVYCIGSLVNGNCPFVPSSTSTAVRFFLTIHDVDFTLNEDDKLLQRTQQDNVFGLYFRLLWGNEERSHEGLDQSYIRLNKLSFDPPCLVSKRIRHQSRITERKLESYTCDFVSESDSEELRRSVFTFVEEETPYHYLETELSADSVDGVIAGKEAQAVAAKLNLSLLVSQKSTSADLLACVPDIITFLKSSILDLTRSHFDAVEYFRIASNLLQITQFLIEVAARNPSKVSLSEQMMTPIAECQSVLKQYVLQSSSDNRIFATDRALPVTEGDSKGDLDYDSTDEMSLSSMTSSDKGIVRNSKKSKRKEPDGYDYGIKRVKRRKGKSSSVIPPNLQCVKAIGSLLIAMEPSFCNCRLVCEALLGTDIDVEPESIQGDMNLNSVTSAISYLRTKEVLLNNVANQKATDAEDAEELTPIVMLCQVVDLVRQCAEPFSRFFAYGNFDCAKVSVETLQLGLTLTGEETKLIVDALSVEDGMRSRFSLRAERAKAATYVYENGSNDFHHAFDKFFTNSIVKAGFDDPNFFLRRLASIAAGVASKMLDEQRILSSVSSRIAPIFSAESAEKIIGMYTDWYVRTGLCTTEEQDVSNIEAKDSLEAMESDSIYTKVVLAGSMSDRRSFIEVLQEISEIPVSRPGLEFMSYRAVEKIAFMKGYSSVEELVDLEAESLLAVWIKKSKDTNRDTYTGFFPPALTSPRAVWYLMLYGRYDYLCQNQLSPEPNEDSMNFRHQSAVNFVRRHRNFIVPFSLLNSHGAISQCKGVDSVIELLSHEFGFKVLLSMTASREEDERDGISKILKRHNVAIQAMCTVLVHSDNVEAKKTGEIILDATSGLLPKKGMELKANGNVPSLIQRLIQLAGQSKNLQELMPFSDASYYGAIKKLTHTMGRSKPLSGDAFIDAGTSLTEVTLYSYDKLMKAKLMYHQDLAWCRFVLLGEFLAYQLEDGRGQIQLDLFLHVLNEIVANSSFCRRIRAEAVSILQNVLRACLRLDEIELSREVCRAINKLVAVCFHLHEECQREIICDLREKAMRQKFDLRRSRGVQQLLNPTGGLQSDRLVSAFELVQLVKTSKSAEMNHNCLVVTHDILLWIVQNKEKLELDCCVFESLSKSFGVLDNCELDALVKADKRYSAQALGKALGANKMGGTLKQYISGLQHRIFRARLVYQQKHPVSRDLNRVSCNHVTVHERLLCAELSKLETVLDEASLAEVLDSSDLSSILGYLFTVGKTSSSSRVRYALSRCIALLDPTILVNDSSARKTDALPSISNYDIVQLELRAKCIDCLAELLKSRKTSVAMAAVTTLEATLSNDTNSNVSSVIAPTTIPLIKPFVFKKQGNRTNSTALFDGEKRSLMTVFGKRSNTGMKANGRSWCWDQDFWTLDNGKSIHFEDWIRRLTSAIIVCCFNPKSGGDDTSCMENSFFWHCQRVTYLDHVFASTIFPLLILTLLQRRNTATRQDQDANDLERSIAKSFETVLFSWNQSDKTNPSIDNDLKVKSLSLVIDTLDVLRKVSQGRFLAQKHKPNKSSTPRKNTKGGHNVGLDPLIPRQKLAYGVTLRLDGIIVAQACMEVKRFASALFFLEMYFNSQYGKSGGLFQELENSASCDDVMGTFDGVKDISGVKPSFETKSSNYDGLKARTVTAMSMTSRCYKELGETELMHSTNMQLSSLEFTANAERKTIDLDNLGCISSFDTLQVLSSHSGQTSNLDVEVVSSLTDSMEAVGLEGMINTYIEGVFAQNKDLRAMVDTQDLREKWFENNLETQNWTRLSRELLTSRGSGRSPLTSLGSRSSRGYFELVSESLNSLSSSDITNSKLALEQAKSSVIDSLSDITRESLSSERFVGIVDKIRALQDVRKLIDDEVDLSRFDFDQMWALKVSSKIRQITLISLAYDPEKTNTLKHLRDHLWKSCDCALSSGRPQVAETELSKLKHLLNFRTESYELNEDKSNEILRIRLQEAKIMECRGDFNGAIQRSKQLIRHIGDQNANKFQNCLLCDAQILCGSWMTKYKTQQAREILDQYLNPAATRARRIFDSDNTIANAKRATEVFIKLGHKLANLHDDLVSRIHSKEWEETETRLQHQHKQCLKSVEHRRELKREYGKLKKNSQRKEELYKHIRETEGHFSRLEKEYNRTQKERNGIKLLLPQYLRQSLDSFLSALQMAGTGSDDLSSHIFRMTSLWFSYQNDLMNDAVVNDVMQERLRKVPSFRFVTLTNQLFSRIDTGEGTNEKFQSALRSLVFRMCNGHPYHCIAPLVTLMNGRVASKRRGVQQIIDEIEQSGARYVRDLLRSYRVLISAYNDLAHVSTTKHHGSNQQKKKKIRFSEVFPSAAKKSLDRCLNKLPCAPCVVTCPPHIRPGKDYGGGKDDPIGAERIAGFDSDFSITDSGVHRPKIVMCTGSKGGSFRQLVKGEDDIRQDAIMSQVFTYVNNLMKRKSNSGVRYDESRTFKTFAEHNRRRLTMITYNVLPLSPSSGVSQIDHILCYLFPRYISHA